MWCLKILSSSFYMNWLAVDPHCRSVLILNFVFANSPRYFAIKISGNEYLETLSRVADPDPMGPSYFWELDPYQHKSDGSANKSKLRSFS
jgi:hypothetical protein